ncbi:LLM class flavin-dependent oxidoreductase [Agrobacterium vitis]|uniref:NtaA/DmoA family FMN-dependent monooxygenase n=1 Tax=Agrobacterium vitis TaxID=373 RepID=A0ABW9TFU9_AGRVI|nr:LLM class flavin-dependent oxidoreductase [Agrobacterium vitis]MUO43030.1 NtaA/DmoA family FMN-dependent monooxygenase [Agrobacterium vitis]
MTRQLLFNAFVVNRPVHQSPGLWRHPRDRSTEYQKLDHWCDLARLLERGLFETMFLADGIGVNENFGGSAEAALRNGSQVPTNDPILLVPAMAQATKHLGFAVTATASFEHPYLLARRYSTLDQLTNGRVGWNIVTGASNSAARGMGRTTVAPRNTRYEIADEFLELSYKLWEGCWEDDAVLWDRQTGHFADPSKVHKVVHHGEHFDLEGIHLTTPSPQRTPLLFQAGASTSGRAFAAKHAECVFLSGMTPAQVTANVTDIRARAAAIGRNPRDLRFFPKATVITAPTGAEAREKYAEYQNWISVEGALMLFSGTTGIDLSHYGPDEPIRYEEREDGVSSALAQFTTDSDIVWTPRLIARYMGIGGYGPVFIGSPSEIADEMLVWAQAADIDGFNLAYAVMPETYADFIDLVIPELQSRGAYKMAYADGTLREKLFGHAHLPATHPGAKFRHDGRAAS